MIMLCANCNGKLDVNPSIGEGIHRQTTCSLCGQLHQWDQPVDPKIHPGRIRTGPPQECTHADCKKPGTKIPSASWEG